MTSLANQQEDTIAIIDKLEAAIATPGYKKLLKNAAVTGGRLTIKNMEAGMSMQVKNEIEDLVNEARQMMGGGMGGTKAGATAAGGSTWI